MKASAIQLFNFAIKSLIIGFIVYLVIAALFMGIFGVFDRLDHLLINLNEQSARVEYIVDTIASQKQEKGSEFTLLKWGISGMIANPEVHYRLAKQYEAQGELEKAFSESSMALALVKPDISKYEETHRQLGAEVNKNR